MHAIHRLVSELCVCTLTALLLPVLYAHYTSTKLRRTAFTTQCMKYLLKAKSGIHIFNSHIPFIKLYLYLKRYIYKRYIHQFSLQYFISNRRQQLLYFWQRNYYYYAVHPREKLHKVLSSSDIVLCCWRKIKSNTKVITSNISMPEVLGIS